MPKETEDDGLLVPFEQKHITWEYRDFYKTKRNNLFVSVTRLPELWEMFRRIDEIWNKGLGDLQVSTDPLRLFPTMFYVNSHAKLRISMELAFSQCLPESRSIMRDAIESAVFAHHMLRKPENLKIWLARDEPGGEKPYKDSFVDHRRQRLFKGLDELYNGYRELSESGSHPTMESFHPRMTSYADDVGAGFRFNYTGVDDEKSLAVEIFTRLLLCYAMEQAFFADFKMRLQFDEELLGMRKAFEQLKEKTRRKIIVKYKVEPPTEKPHKR